MQVLVVDDDATLRRTTRIALESMKHQVAEARDGGEALDRVAQRPFQVALLDLRLGDEQGLVLLPQLLALAPRLHVVIVTAYATIETAVEAMRQGAADYLPKPFTPGQLRVALDRINRLNRLQSAVEDLEEQVHLAVPEADLTTQEPRMQEALSVAFRAAESDAAVLLRGESGTGKGVLARAIHARSRRAAAPFITVACPALSAELLESELFGHVQGAFTGALRDVSGKVAAAETGTLLLDEIGDLPSALQPKLLRLLQEKCYERVGDVRTRAADVRLLAATNRPLEQQIASGHFREDLFYRLNVIEVTLPPLRCRPADILPLAEHLVRFFARQNGKCVRGLTGEAQAALGRHAWPGNIRELRNAIERAVILCTGEVLGVADLPSAVGQNASAGVALGSPVTLDDLEAEHIRRVLSVSPSVEAAASVLGIDPSTLWRKRKRYGL
jgi:NtrC-family two-component system response regulator AlgB